TTTREVSERVGAARQRQLARQGCANAHLDLLGMHRNCALAEADRRWLEAAGERLELSLRALHRILKVARTLADLDERQHIERQHLAEALQYRPSASG
ncbi:magnesium chelatase, partial [Pseudomonas aeruginosa]|nr:magnesium chelatase [Pseudomonas aeruginosa]